MLKFLGFVILFSFFSLQVVFGMFLYSFILKTTENPILLTSHAFLYEGPFAIVF